MWHPFSFNLTSAEFFPESPVRPRLPKNLPERKRCYGSMAAILSKQ